MNAPEQARAVFLEAREILDAFLADAANFEALAKAAGIMAAAMRAGGKVISCGNGGSMCDAMHFAEELSGRFRGDRRALPAVSISDPSHLTCTANDYGFDQVFSRYVEAVGNAGDVLLAISTSGNSKNVLRAIEAAREKKMTVVGLTGRDGGQMAGRCDIELRAPQSEFADRAQEIHIKMIHTLIQLIEAQV